MRTQWRRPRLLLIIGPSKGLDLKEQIKRLGALDRAGRISLHTLTGEQSSSDVALQSLRDPQGWDGLIYLGHGDPSPEGGGGLRLERGVLAGPALADALRQAAPQLVLLSRCHGTDLVPLCLEAGVPWVLAFRGKVPDPVALEAFAPFWQALVEGGTLLEATTRAHDALERTHPGSSPLLSLVGRVDAEPLRLLLRRRHLWQQRLASSQKRQLVATGLALGLGLVVYGPGSGAGVPWELPNALLDFRLDAQKKWRDLRGVPSTPPADGRPSPLVVWLLSHDYAYPPNSREQVSRQVLIDVLSALPPKRAPVVGIDVVLNDDGAQPVQPDATKALADLIKAQRRPELFNIFYSDKSKSRGTIGEASLPSPILRQNGLRSFNGTLGIPEDSRKLQITYSPLQLNKGVGQGTFAWKMAQALGGAPASGGLPAGSVIDWSINWLAPSVIQVVWVDDKRFKSLRSAAPPLPSARGCWWGWTGGTWPARAPPKPNPTQPKMSTWYLTRLPIKRPGRRCSTREPRGSTLRMRRHCLARSCKRCGLKACGEATGSPPWHPCPPWLSPLAWGCCWPLPWSAAAITSWPWP